MQDNPGGSGNEASPRREWSAGGVVVRPTSDGPHVLLIRDPYGRWGLPKGHVEAGEESPDTALREVEEETGLQDVTLGPYVMTIDWHFRLRGRLVWKHCDFYLMASRQGEPQPQREEGIRECRWVPLDRAPEAVGYDNAREVVRRAGAALTSLADGAESPYFPPWRDKG